MNAIQKAIDLTGSATSLAKSLGVTVQAVCFWRDGKRLFPADLCIKLECVTSRVITCEELRPDVDWAYLRGTAKATTTTEQGVGHV